MRGGGAELNQQGYALLQRGDYDGAIPVLQRAVDSYPADSKDLNYGYALFNLGSALRRAGTGAGGHPDPGAPAGHPQPDEDGRRRS